MFAGQSCLSQELACAQGELKMATEELALAHIEVEEEQVRGVEKLFVPPLLTARPLPDRPRAGTRGEVHRGGESAAVGTVAEEPVCGLLVQILPNKHRLGRGEGANITGRYATRDIQQHG